MFVNLNMIAAALIGAILFYAGRLLAGRLTTLWSRGLAIMLLVVGCFPSLMFLAYYFHLFGEPLWYIEWRSLPYTEVLSSLCAPFFGFISAKNAYLFPASKGLLRFPIAMVGALLVFVPYAKPVLLPVSTAAHWSNSWRDGVCLQSSPSTCGPASLATLFAQYGMKRTEQEIARASYSCASGTELWYLVRYARRQGLPVTCRHEPSISQVNCPAVIGTGVGRFGHFIAILNEENGRITVGDPLIGRIIMTEAEFASRYHFDGCVLDGRKASRPPASMPGLLRYAPSMGLVQ